MNYERSDDLLQQLKATDMCVHCVQEILESVTDEELEDLFWHTDYTLADELLIGFHDQSQWVAGALVINANQANITFCNTIAGVVFDKMQDRGLIDDDQHGDHASSDYKDE
jgi:hypothetical protein